MKLVDGMKDEKLGSALLYNFTRGYGKVPMAVYNIVLPLLYHDEFRNALSDSKDVSHAIQTCLQKDSDFKSTIVQIMDALDNTTSKALGISLINKDLDFQIVDGTMMGICNASSILEMPEAILLGKYLQGLQLEEIVQLLKIQDIQIVFLDGDTLGRDIDLSPLEKFGRLITLANVKDEEVGKAIKNANIIITNKKYLGAEQLQEAKHVRLVCVTATGFNNIDTDYCHRHNITVCNVKGYSTNSVAQHTFALLLDLFDKTHYYHHYVASGNYSGNSMFSHFANSFNELAGKTWGIVGMGDIGQKVANIASVFGCQVQYYSTSGKNQNQGYSCVDFDTLLQTSDIISIHAPLNQNTLNLFTREAFIKMKNTAYLINVGRGRIVNEQDLVIALKEKQIAGAGLDVFEHEPFYQDSPLLDIKDPTKLIMTPHIAWATVEARNRVVQEVAKNIQAFCLGEKRNVC